MTDTTSVRATTSADGKDPSLGELVATATRDLSALMRQEVALAKAEIQQDVTAVAKGAGMFAGAAFVGFLALVFLSVAAAFGIEGLGLPLGVGFLIVAGVYLLLGAILGLVGKKSLGKISPPRRTIETVKDDLAWARHPTVSPNKSG